MSTLKVDITPDPSKGKVDHYTFLSEVQAELINFLSSQPYAEVKQHVTLVESQHLSEDEVANLINFIAKFPLYIVIHLFQLIITEGSIIPIYEENVEAE